MATSYTYDLNGSRIQKQVAGGDTTTYAFDTLDRLATASVNGTPVFAASYDYRTRRLTKTEGGTGTYFRYDGGDSFHEVASGTTTIQVEFIRGSGMGGGIGSILYSDRVLSGGSDEYFTYNAVGHTVALTNGLGVATKTDLYEAYGGIVSSTGFSLNNRLANTKERDASIGLDNHGFRYFDPEVGRYLTTDPIGYGDGMNWYVYVHCNPINRIDPLGLDDWWEIGAAVLDVVKTTTTWPQTLCRKVGTAVKNYGIKNGNEYVAMWGAGTETVNSWIGGGCASEQLNHTIDNYEGYKKNGHNEVVASGNAAIRATPILNIGHLAPEVITGQSLGGTDQGRNLDWTERVGKASEITAQVAGPKLVGTFLAEAQLRAELGEFNAANLARDSKMAELSQLSGKQQANVSTVVGAVNKVTGETTVAMKCRGQDFGKCAEDLAVEQLQCPKENVMFSAAERPRTGEIVPVCQRCQTKYSASQFPPEAQHGSPRPQQTNPPVLVPPQNNED